LASSAHATIYAWNRHRIDFPASFRYFRSLPHPSQAFPLSRLSFIFSYRNDFPNILQLAPITSSTFDVHLSPITILAHHAPLHPFICPPGALKLARHERLHLPIA